MEDNGLFAEKGYSEKFGFDVQELLRFCIKYIDSFNCGKDKYEIVENIKTGFPEKVLNYFIYIGVTSFTKKLREQIGGIDEQIGGIDEQIVEFE